MIVEPTREGLSTAKRQGRTGGRKRTMTKSKLASAKKLLNRGIHAKDVVADLDVLLTILYR